MRRGMTRAGLISLLLGAQTQSELTITGCRWCVCPPCCLLCVCSRCFLCGMPCDHLLPAPGRAQVAHCSSFLNKLLQFVSACSWPFPDHSHWPKCNFCSSCFACQSVSLIRSFHLSARQTMASCWIFFVTKNTGVTLMRGMFTSISLSLTKGNNTIIIHIFLPAVTPLLSPPIIKDNTSEPNHDRREHKIWHLLHLLKGCVRCNLRHGENSGVTLQTMPMTTTMSLDELQTVVKTEQEKINNR